ncbi:hypothetical protein BJF92_15485 [Rhizobium rhizosphaerae]|uniref:Uncharacterized protein n=1 Tax=Xaviernesmea rhizosphaerae TaxID=1672749 RepID=A0A1Q9AM01_9HYPH|nr:hypothetical protein BJF92_15485 [Xaviernesmea rhizosphaerae]
MPRPCAISPCLTKLAVILFKAFIFLAMSLGRPARLPLSTSAFFTHSLSVCAEKPIFAAIEHTFDQQMHVQLRTR